jgi:hypothetical protein
MSHTSSPSPTPTGSRRSRFTTPPAFLRPASLSALDWNRIFNLAAAGALTVGFMRAIAYYVAIPDPAASVGVDFRLYIGAAQRWLASGQFYEAAQIAGPYHVHDLPAILYPPPLLLVLLPFLVLPAVLYWLIPAALTLFAIARIRPSGPSLFLAACLLATDWVQAPVFWGTPVMWLMPAVALGLLYGWPAAAILAKPTLGLFLLTGLTRPRRLAAGIIGFVVLSLAFLPMWFDYLAVVRNSDLNPAYGWSQNLLLLVPVVAWLGRTNGSTPTLPHFGRFGRSRA